MATKTTRTNVSRWVWVALGTLWTTGCMPQIVVGEGATASESALNGANGGEGGGGGATGGVAQGGGAPTGDGIAISRAQLDAYWAAQESESSSGQTSSSGGGGELDPAEIFLIFGDPVPTCADPYKALACGGEWRVSIPVAVAAQAPGLLDLSDPALNAFATETGPLGAAPEDCWWGGGSFLGGTLEIVSFDAAVIEMKLTDSGEVNDFDADGARRLVRCP